MRQSRNYNDVVPGQWCFAPYCYVSLAIGLRWSHLHTRCRCSHLNTLQHTATHCITLQWRNFVVRVRFRSQDLSIYLLDPSESDGSLSSFDQSSTVAFRDRNFSRIKSHCNTLQHTATHCNTLHYIAMAEFCGPSPVSIPGPFDLSARSI